MIDRGGPLMSGGFGVFDLFVNPFHCRWPDLP